MRANLILPWAGALCGLALTLGACNDDSGPTAVKKATSDAVSGDASGDTVAADTAADSAVADVAVDAASDASASDATAGDTTLADATTASDGSYGFSEPPGIYIITVDSSNASGSLNGLIPTVLKNGQQVFEANSPVMVWSAGPDKLIDPTSPANKGANKDNILGWKQ